MLYRALPLLALLLPACGGVDATNIATSDMRATYRVTASGDGTTYAEAILLLISSGTSPQYVAITETETLSVSLGGTEVPLEQETQGVILYSAIVNEDPTGEFFTFSYERVAWPSAPVSSVMLPPMAETVTANERFSPNSALAVTWPGTFGSARLTVSGDCIETYGAEVDLNVGEHTVPGSEITEVGDVRGCPVEITLFAETPGEVDEAFGPGSQINGRSRRDTTATWAP